MIKYILLISQYYCTKREEKYEENRKSAFVPKIKNISHLKIIIYYNKMNNDF